MSHIQIKNTHLIVLFPVMYANLEVCVTQRRQRGEGLVLFLSHENTIEQMHDGTSACRSSKDILFS